MPYRRQTNYRQKKGYGKGLGVGGQGFRSGYFRPSRDFMAPYRQATASETQYSRNLKNKLLRDELSGPSSFSFNKYNYRSPRPPAVEVEGVTKEEVGKLVTASMKGAFEKFLEATGKSEVPKEVVFLADDVGQGVAKGFPELSKTETKPENETENEKGETVESLQSLDELNDIRQEQIREKDKELEKAESFEELERITAEKDEINGKFFNQMDELKKTDVIEPDSAILQDDKFDEIMHQKYGIESEPLPLDTNEIQRKRTNYDSEVGEM